MRRTSLRWILPTLLTLQLGLLWIQGAQLHRQNLLLQDMHEDLQALLEHAGVSAEQDEAQDDRVAPARVCPTDNPHNRRYTRVALRRAPASAPTPISWRRWALGGAFVLGMGVVALFRLRRRH